MYSYFQGIHSFDFRQRRHDHAVLHYRCAFLQSDHLVLSTCSPYTPDTAFHRHFWREIVRDMCVWCSDGLIGRSRIVRGNLSGWDILVEHGAHEDLIDCLGFVRGY